MTDPLIEQCRQFYRYFNPNMVVCVFHDKLSWENEKKYQTDPKQPPHSVFVSTEEEFITFVVMYHMRGNIFAPYRTIRHGSQRGMESVTSSNFFFIDIDNDRLGNESAKFERFMERSGLTFSAKVDSGGGWHYFIPHSAISVDDSNRNQLIDMSSRLKIWLQENGIGVDPKIFDIARLTRVWGTFNIKRERHCSVMSVRDPTNEEKSLNLEFISKLKPKSIPIYTSKHAKCSNCNVYESCIREKLKKDNVRKNDVLFKNAAAFARENNRDPRELQDMAKNQDHSESEFFSPSGWYSRNDIEFNCYEMQKWVTEFFPEKVKEWCRKCMLDNSNQVIYLNDDSKKMSELKKEYRETPKFIVNRYYTLRGIIEPVKMNKTTICVGWVFRREIGNSENDGAETVVSLDDIGDDKKDYVTFYIGESVPTAKEQAKMGLVFVKELFVGVYIYNFLCDGTQLKLLSEDEIDPGEYCVDGVIIETQDKILLGETKKVVGAIKIMFCHTARATVAKFKSWGDVFLKFRYDYDTVTDYLSSVQFSESEKYILEQPPLFMRLIYSFLFSSRLEGYPLHLIVSGVPGVGKSKMMTALHKKFPGEMPAIGAENSTIKGFVPSYWSSNPSRGFLLRARRILFVDEFFGLISRASGDRESEGKVIEGFNNILMNEERSAGSGISEYKMKMSAKTYWATNPMDTMKEDFIWSLKQIPANTVQRFLFFHCGEQWKNWISAEPSHMRKGETSVDTNDWLSLYDFMQDSESSKVNFDVFKIQKIMKRLQNMVPAEISNILYHTRTMNHSAVLVMEGIVKTRILFERDLTLTANDQDYQLFEDLWIYIIESWKSGQYEWVQSPERQLSTKQKVLLQLIPEEGVWGETLYRQYAKIGGTEEEYKDSLKFFRTRGLIKNGRKENNEHNKIFKEKNNVVTLQETLNLTI